MMFSNKNLLFSNTYLGAVITVSLERILDIRPPDFFDKYMCVGVFEGVCHGYGFGCNYRYRRDA